MLVFDLIIQMRNMNFVLLLLLLFIGLTCANPTNSNKKGDEDNTSDEEEDQLFPDQWLEVPLDHFNLFDNRTWKMRYFVNDEFFIKGKPLFIEVGGEWTINGLYLKQGQLYKLAKQHQGMLVETEHRYYGKSIPFSTYFPTENLQYLQIEQALEDLAFFIEHFKSITPGLENSQVVLHGCSYPGMLVTWMRLRFPHIVDISYASSAPLGVGLDYPGYYEIVRDTYANVSVSCIDDIKAGFNRTSELLKTKEGRQVVKDALRGWGCASVDNMNSYSILNVMLSILNVQNDPINYEEISCFTLSMDADDTSAFHRLVNLVRMKSKDQRSCSDDDSESETSNENKGDSNKVASIIREYMAWRYQTCTEMGTFITLNRENSKHPFALDSTVDEAVDECVKDFGGMVTEQTLRTGIERVTRRYGGKKPKVTKVVTVQGMNDPWRDLAVLEDYTPEAPVLVAKGSHCIDLYENDKDPEDLVQIRNKVRNIISDWINNVSS